MLPRIKKGWLKMNMTRPWFYVEDERGNQLVEPDFKETPIYGEAEKMARKMSRERGIKTRVNVLNGLIECLEIERCNNCINYHSIMFFTHGV